MRTAHLLALFLSLSLAPACEVSVRRSHVGHGGGELPGKAERELEVPFELHSGQTVRLELDAGAIVTQAAAGATGLAPVRLRMAGRSDEEARAWIDEYEFVASPDGQGVLLALKGEPHAVEKGLSRWEVRPTADVRLNVPEGVKLELKTRSGSIEARGALAECKLESSYGSVSLHGARGAVTAKSSSGKVTIEDVEGDLQARSGYGAVVAQHVRAESIELESSSGAVELRDSSASEIQLMTRYGALELERIKGAVTAKTSSGRVNARDIDGARIELASGYGAIQGERLSGSLDISSSSGKIAIEASEGALQASTKYGSLLADGVWSAVRAESSSGAVEVCARAGSTLMSDWELRSGYGKVALLAPGDFACELDAQTRYGEALCDFPLTIEAGARAKSGRLTGRVAGGGPKVTLHSSSGDVALRKLDVR